MPASATTSSMLGAATRDRGVDSAGEQAELLVAADHRRRRLARAGRPAASSASSATQASTGSSRPRALTGPSVGVAHDVARRSVRGVADHDLAGLRGGLQPAGACSPRRPWRCSRRRRASAPTRTSPVLMPMRIRRPPTPAAASQSASVRCIARRRANGTLGVVLVRDRRTEQREDRVADDLVDLAAVGRDVGDEALEASRRRGSSPARDRGPRTGW